MRSKENYSGVKGFLKFITRVSSWTTLVILILLAIFLAYYMISVKIYSDRGEDFEPFISLYTIVSGSMEPNINVYDVVITKKVKSPSEIKENDVITFISSSSISKNMIITHRVVGVLEKDGEVSYKTKGDNNMSPDTSPALFNNVKGKVILRIPFLGRIQTFIATQGGWLLVIVLPAFAIILSDIIKIFKLAGVKNEIEKIEEDKKRFKKEKSIREEKRKEEIKKRLKLDKSIYEKEPIVTYKSTKIVVGKKLPSKTILEEEPKVYSRSEARYQEKPKNNKKSKTKKKKKN